MSDALPATTAADPPAAAPAAQAGAASAWSYTVSVRELCEFSAKRGDLDRRFTPSATALEGLQGQQAVAGRRGPDYQTELALQGRFGALRVRGRADGYDPGRRCLEEVKTVRGRPEEIADNRRQLHWAQLETYGALFCAERGLDELTLALVYVDAADQSEIVLRQLFGAAELQQRFEARCTAFLGWAQQEAWHRSDRDAALRQLAFPPGEFRAGQRELAAAVYRAAVNRRCLLAQAPTGNGKTVGTLFALLHAMPASGIDKIAYLTCKGTAGLAAMQALATLRGGAAGRTLRVLSLVAKDQACEHPDKACHGDACPLARGFYDRLPAARTQAVAEGWLDAPALRRIALQHGLCPYYLGQELQRWADVLVGDVNHFFDAKGQLWGLMQALDWQLALLVDEAHNLVDRARRMYSAELTLAQLLAAAQAAPAALRPPLAALQQRSQDLLAAADAPYAVLETAPETWVQALQSAASALAEFFRQQPLAVGPLLDFHFELQRWLRLVDALGAHSLFELHSPTADEAWLGLRNVVPAGFLRQRFQALHSATLFSATLAPPDYAIRLLGLPDNSAWIDLPPAFAAEHLRVQVADGLSTRYADRARSLKSLVGVISRQFDACPGNYLAFFSSFDYLQQAADLLAAQRPDITQWRQDRRMAPAARRDFLDRFQPEGRGIGFAVLGGVFAEGVDLPGRLLIGAFIATLGLPPVSPAQDQIQARLDQLFGADHGYADRVPAMQKVVQAAGRVLRTPQDRGWLWLLDDRYRRADIVALLPPGWQIG